MIILEFLWKRSKLMDIVFENNLKPYKLLASVNKSQKSSIIMRTQSYRSGDITYGREIPVKTKW